MGRPLMLSELGAMIPELLARHGDLPIFTGDMQPARESAIKVVAAEEPEKYGTKYVHFGEW